MSLVPLNLYCFPSDVYDYVGTQGAQLRLDDANEATGQVVRATATAAEGATALLVTALAAPLLSGSVLVFQGGGMEASLEVTLAATALLGATSLTVQPLASPVTQYAQAEDSGVNVATAVRLLRSCQYGTSRVKLYLCGRYDDDALQTCYSARRFAMTAAGKWLCTRRGQTPPRGIQDDWEECLEEMRMVQSGQMMLEDIGTRTSGWPFITNVTVDIRYNTNKARVEQTLSELTPTQYGQYVDWNSIYTLAGY